MVYIAGVNYLMKIYDHSEILPFMLGSGFFTLAIGEPPAPVGWPARPAGLGDPVVGRTGDSCNTETGHKKTVYFSQANRK